MPIDIAVFDVLMERGLISHCSDLDGLKNHFEKNPNACTYLGIDATVSSLHIEHLLPLMVVLHILKAKGKIIFFLGVPKGRKKKITDVEQEKIRHNLDLLQHFLVNWLAEINEQTNFEFVRNPSDNQYDFSTLYDTHDCVLQIGKSDQWDNIINDIKLNKKKGKNLFGLVTPPFAYPEDKKINKKNFAYKYWQFFRNTPDENVEAWWNYFTFEKFRRSPDINKTKERLAMIATAIYHGEFEALDSKAKALTKFNSPHRVNKSK